jgi:hypothetical protein
MSTPSIVICRRVTDAVARLLAPKCDPWELAAMPESASTSSVRFSTTTSEASRKRRMLRPSEDLRITPVLLSPRM